MTTNLPTDSDRVLVAIVNNIPDFARARNQRWYRIPVHGARKWVGNRWPPRWLAFYQTEVFGTEKYSVRYFAHVLDFREVSRWELFPEEVSEGKALHHYYRLDLGSLEALPTPIMSRRWRRITFIRTTWGKFTNAVEINDLFDESPLEDRLWAELKRRKISAERQEFISTRGHSYRLDFAFQCKSGNLNVETDGDLWHSHPRRIVRDNVRDNDLETSGWKLLRFNTYQINDQMADYCLPMIVENIRSLGGISEEHVLG